MQATLTARELTAAEKRYVYLTHIAIGFGIFLGMGIPALIVGGLLGAGFGFLTWIGGTIYVIYRMVKKTLGRVQSVFDSMAKVLPTALGRVDFYHMEAVAGIALDVENRRMAFIRADLKGKVDQPITFDIEKIRGYRAHSPGHTEVKVYATHVSQMGASYAADMDNLRAREQAAMQTGLYIDLDDIANPTIAVIMPYTDAEAWLLLIEKALNGTLEKRDTPTVYPFMK